MPRALVEPLEGRTLMATGELDPDFGDGGVMVLRPQLEFPTHLDRVLVQPDNKLIVSGYVGRFTYELRRYGVELRTDSSFGDHGIVATPDADLYRAETLDLGVQPDGKIVRLYSGPHGLSGRTGATRLQRFLPDGTLDPAFGDAGEVLLQERPRMKFRPTQFILDPDGSILVVGSAPKHPIVLRRLHADGTRDESFGDGGEQVFRLPKVLARFTGSLHRLPNGRFLFVGSNEAYKATKWGYTSASRMVLARFFPDGSLDRDYGTNGLSKQPIRADRRDRAMLSDHLVLDDGSVIVSAIAFGRHSFAMRFDGDGRFDERFGGGKGTGRAILYRSGLLTDRESVTLAVAPGGRILFTLPTLEKFARGTTVPDDVLLGRLTSRGRRDRTFGTNGVTLTDVGDYDDPVYVRAGPDGSVLVVAESNQRSAEEIAVVLKYQGD
jgi:uncharacterized delta-60 repeat protein